MTWEPPERNYDRVQFEASRRAVDSPYTKAHDELSAAYYDHWRHGESAPWRGYDVQPTPEASKVLFDKLHGHIEDLRTQAMILYNAKAARKDPALSAWAAEVEDGGKTRAQVVAARVAAVKATGIALTVEEAL
jgi:hypothetical protein